MTLAKKTLLFIPPLVVLVALGFYGWRYYQIQAETPANNNYEQPAAYPQSTELFVLQARELYSDPMNGIGLRYVTKANRKQNLDINIYPVGALSWDNNPNLLDDEANVILADMDYLISQKQWQSRIEVIREPLMINDQQGLRVHFKLLQDKTRLYKIVYLFVQQDKYLKFTYNSSDTSVNALAQSWVAVNNILPLIQAPPESPYAHRVRQAHLEKMKKKVQELLQKPAVKQ